MGIAHDQDWAHRVEALWAAFDDHDPEDFLARVRRLTAERLPGDAAALFELACAHDSTGHAYEAAVLYRQALATGLTGLRRRRAVIQLASTLRNLGDPATGVLLLETERTAFSDELDDAVVAVLALCLADTGRSREATGVAVGALARHLPRYQRSMAAYARALADPGGTGPP